MSFSWKRTGLEVDGIPVEICSLHLPGGLELDTTNLGAAALAIRLPDQEENRDVLLGFSGLEAQLKKGPMFGVTLGRCAGKILRGACEFNGQPMQLSLSHGEHHAHGGSRGFDKRAFSVLHTDDSSVTYRYISPDGEEGYPGTLTLDVCYRVSEDTVTVSYRAVSDADTIVNISNHMYFNLFGSAAGNAGAQRVMLQAGAYSCVDERGIPLGKIQSVDGTAMDFRSGAVLNDQLSRLQTMGIQSLDHDYLLDTVSGPAAVVQAPGTGRCMEIYTDSPCIHLYLCDLGEMQYPGKDGVSYTGRCGLCLEPMHASDSVNNGVGPAPFLPANTVWTRETSLHFSWNGCN